MPGYYGVTIVDTRHSTLTDLFIHGPGTGACEYYYRTLKVLYEQDIRLYIILWQESFQGNESVYRTYAEETCALELRFVPTKC